MTNVSAAVFPETATDYEFACLMKAGNVPRTATREALANKTVTPDCTDVVRRNASAVLRFAPAGA
jgi:hypothetical protein